MRKSSVFRDDGLAYAARLSIRICHVGIAYRSAWFMCHRIRYAIAQEPMAGLLSGTVEADETFIGGKMTGVPVRGGTAQLLKTPVVTLVERGGEARSRVMPVVNSRNLAEYVWKNFHADSVLMTDSSSNYNVAGKSFAAHETVDHHVGEYARGRAHVSSAEGFFSQLELSLSGTHHHVSAHHLHRYVSKFDYRYSTRKQTDSARTVAAIRKTTGKRLMYREATKKAPGSSG